MTQDKQPPMYDQATGDVLSEECTLWIKEGTKRHYEKLVSDAHVQAMMWTSAFWIGVLVWYWAVSTCPSL